MGARIDKGMFVMMMTGAIGRVRSGCTLLSELDSAGGDGDHGTTMHRAMGLLERALPTKEEERLSALIDRLRLDDHGRGWRGYRILVRELLHGHGGRSGQ